MQEIEKGFNALGHLSPFLDESRSIPYYQSHARMIAEATERIGKIREAVGLDVDLCIENHRRLKPKEAVVLAKELEPFHPLFYEDPIIPDNFDSMAYVSDKIQIPLATGERIHTIQEYSMLLRREALDYVRISIGQCGGFTGAKKIAAMAEANGVGVIPHNPYSPVTTAACINLAASIPNFTIQEYPDPMGPAASERYVFTHSGIFPFRAVDLVKEAPVCENGYLLVSDKPGIGVELEDDVDLLFPYKRREIVTRLSVDGSVIDT